MLETPALTAANGPLTGHEAIGVGEKTAFIGADRVEILDLTHTLALPLALGQPVTALAVLDVEALACLFSDVGAQWVRWSGQLKQPIGDPLDARQIETDRRASRANGGADIAFEERAV